MAPRFKAHDIAKYLAKKHDIPVVLGSATPDISTYHNSKNVIRLTRRANSSNLPDVEVIDLRQELAIGNRTILSERLKEEIENNLKEKKQTILFLNRRGFSTFVMCRDCGYTVKCKRCNISLTYHMKEDKLKCHYCGYEMNNIKICPKCKSKNIKHFGSGTQKLEELIHNIYPQATTIRMDIDTVSKKNSHEEILNKFKNENIDILIGTQMVVKGHHFPNVTLVGVIAADSSLNTGDYRANERTFQLLEQVSGRSGRGKKQGTVMIQTYNPDHFVLQCVKNHDYQMFYKKEMEIRQLAKYPPYCYLISVLVQGKKEEEVIWNAKQMKEYLKKQLPHVGVLGPAPCTIYKMSDIYRQRMTLKVTKTDHLYETLQMMMDYYNKKGKVNVICDFNPYTTI